MMNDMVRDILPVPHCSEDLGRGAESPSGARAAPRPGGAGGSPGCSRGLRKRLTTFLLTTVCWLAVAVASPTLTYAQGEENTFDARLEGFVEHDPIAPPDKRQSINVGIEKSGTALTWILFLVLIVIACGPLFKDAKRSHLD